MLAAIWLDVLGDVPDELLDLATNQFLRSDAQWFPTPGQLRTRATELAQGNVAEIAATAWQRFADWDFGHGDSVADDPLILKTIARLGGANYIGSLESEKVANYIRRDFIRWYSECYERQTALALPAGQGRADALIAATTKRLTVGK